MIPELVLPGVQWEELQSSKLDWAYRAYRSFISELSEDVRAHLTHSAAGQEPYVVVFGKTQVGKTTLLLELMGLEADAQVRVGSILRGGRQIGKSATATAMEYRRSPDHGWYLDDGSGARRINSDGEMREALGELRHKMSMHQLPAEQPVVVSIPDDCFMQAKEGGIGARMLDLPGDNPADEVERQHVEQMAKRYVPYADLILLVGRGDDLSFLNPDALTLPSIEDWQSVPNRFRIITTFSFSPYTVQQFVRSQEGELNAGQFRGRLIEQIRTFGLPLSPEAEQASRYFPLEFGQSWHAMLRGVDEFARRVKPVADALKAQLHADICASANESARFRNALDVHFVAKRKRAACIAKGEAKLADLAEHIRRSEAAVQQASEGEEAAAQQYKAALALLRRREAAEAELSTTLAFDAAGYLSGLEVPSTSTGALLGRINNFKSWLRQRFLSTAPAGDSARKFIGKSSPNLAGHIGIVDRIANDEFMSLKKRMSGYSLDEYYPALSNSFANDLSRLNLDVRDATKKTAEYCQTLWRKQLENRAAELAAEAAEADYTRLAMEQIRTQQQTKLKLLAKQSQEVKDEMESTLARLDSDARTTAHFATMLDEEYLTELQRRHEQVATAETPVEALLTLMSVASIGEEYRKIKLS